MSNPFIAKILGGVTGITAISVPSIGWACTKNSLNNEDLLRNDIKEELRLEGSLATEKAKQELKGDISFLNELQKKGLKKKYEGAKSNDFTDSDGFCHLLLNKEKITKVKENLHTSEEQLKELISGQEKNYSCIAYSELKTMSEQGYTHNN